MIFFSSFISNSEKLVVAAWGQDGVVTMEGLRWISNDFFSLEMQMSDVFLAIVRVCLRLFFLCVKVLWASLRCYICIKVLENPHKKSWGYMCSAFVFALYVSGQFNSVRKYFFSFWNLSLWPVIFWYWCLKSRILEFVLFQPLLHYLQIWSCGIYSWVLL